MKIGQGEEITGLTTVKDATGGCIVALCTLGGILQLWVVDAAAHMTSLFSKQLDIVPKTVSFSSTRDRLVVFGSRCGTV